jgi:hypothetical protein
MPHNVLVLLPPTVAESMLARIGIAWPAKGSSSLERISCHAFSPQQFLTTAVGGISVDQLYQPYQPLDHLLLRLVGRGQGEGVNKHRGPESGHVASEKRHVKKVQRFKALSPR